MTISSTTRVAGPFIGNGTATVFPFTFKVFAAADLDVIRLNTSTGVESTLVLNSDYTVTLNGNQNTNPGGSVTLSAGALATGLTLTITSDIANLQPTDLTNQGGFYPEVITDSLDRATIQIQQMADDLDRSMKAPISDGSPDMDLPAASVRANSFLAFDANGKPTIIPSSGSGAPVGSTSASLVTYDQGGSGAAIRSVQARLRECVYAADFGAVGDGVTDDTAALRAALAYAIPLGRTVVLRGTYRITGPLQQTSLFASGELHLYCDGAVTINVDAASTAFFYVILFQTSAINNVSITGGSLQIECAQKAAYGLYLRHSSSTQGGTINLECPITVLNCKQNTNNQNAAAIAAYGRYYRIDINDATVIGVERLNVGVCRGIEVGEFNGDVTIRRPYIKNILCPVTDLKDADGIAVAGMAGADVQNDFRAGRCIIDGGTFIDCQGRCLKSQCSDTVVLAPRVYRQNAVTITNGHDFDFQFGGGYVRDAYLEYRLNGMTSPLGASFIPLAFQNRMQDRVLNAYCLNTTIVSDVAFNTFCGIFYSATALSSTTVIDGIDIQPTAAIATAVINRSIAEIPAVETTLVAMPGTATVRVRNVCGPMDAKGVAYTGYSGGAVASKLIAEASNIRSTLAPGAFSYAIGSMSGSVIKALDSFLMRDNHNVRNVFMTFSGAMEDFDFAKLEVGNVFGIDLAAAGTITNAPPWETGTDCRAFVEVLARGGGNSVLTKVIRVTTFGNASGSTPVVFLSSNNASTWQVLGACPPVTKGGDFTVAANENVLINNKSGSTCVVTLPSASTWTGRRILIKTIQAQAVNSASSDVVPLAGGAAGTSILTATAGKYAELVSNGTNWVIMAAN